MDALLSTRVFVSFHDLVFLLSDMGGATHVEAFRNAAAGAFGLDALYRDCHGDSFTFYEVLALLASSGEIDYRGDEVSLVRPTTRQL